ncbi:MAG: 1-deoxy-D-xylulose-5-phosphate reductoisomerase [Rhodospirillales bacterium]|nr:1-deoxy-D-xylulose-5-phosphate reductoisomerase [Rhodospirillales bacterium]
MAEIKTINILGATGSVGRSTVDLVLSQPDRFSVQAVTANENARALADMAVQLKARKAVVADPRKYQELKESLSGTGVEAAAGAEALLDAAAQPVDWTMAAIVGMAGLLPIMKAIEHSRCVAIANKEPLVAAGPLVMEAAKKHGTKLLPVDSEHNAVFQVFDHERPAGIDRIILTASGGPFRTWTREKMAAATPEQAVAHPNWSMGAKISVDSASMMNKALEVIEAHYLFAMPPEKIKVLVHPQSVIHSMVEYSDGSVLAQLGAPDMRTPIAHALAWPDRMKTSGQRLDWAKLKHLDFEDLDDVRFPAVDLAYQCLNNGAAACIAFNAANEVAVDAFLSRRLGFSGIIEAIRQTLRQAGCSSLKNLEEVIAFDATVRDITKSYISRDAA